MFYYTYKVPEESVSFFRMNEKQLAGSSSLCELTDFLFEYNTKLPENYSVHLNLHQLKNKVEVYDGMVEFVIKSEKYCGIEKVFSIYHAVDDYMSMGIEMDEEIQYVDSLKELEEFMSELFSSNIVSRVCENILLRAPH